MAKLILFSGPPGVGKSTLSYRLAKEKNLTLLTLDQIQRSMEKNEVIAPVAAYRVLLDLAELNLKRGNTVIMDAVFPRTEFRTEAMEIASRSGAMFSAVVCTCSDEILWRKRIDDRPALVDGWTPVGWDDVEHVRSYYEAWDTEHLLLDAVSPLEENYQKLLTYAVSTH